MRKTSSLKTKTRSGFSLLEVTIATMMGTMVVTMAAGVAFDVSRHMADNIVKTQVALEARLTIESFRRDFGGYTPDLFHEEIYEWRLVGIMIPTSNELRLCYDHDLDASADWVDPDWVVTYTFVDDRILRSDAVTGVTVTVAHNVSDIQFSIDGNDINIEIEFQVGGFTETYTFVTSNL
jgi:type II secretory pathway pseudopilin PulG